MFGKVNSPQAKCVRGQPHLQRGERFLEGEEGSGKDHTATAHPPPQATTRAKGENLVVGRTLEGCWRGEGNQM